MVWILPLIVLLQPAVEPRPWLGVSLTVHAAEIRVGERVFKHGIELQRVVPDSPAARAGLEAGDIVLAAAGMDFDCPTDDLLGRFRAAIAAHEIGETFELQVLRDGVERCATVNGQTLEDTAVWQDPEAHAAGREPGTRLAITFERVRALRSFAVVLGPAPLEANAIRSLPENDAIFPRPPAHLDEERLADALVKRFDVQAEYDDLRHRLAGLVERGDALRLPRFAYALREPFALPALSRRLADVPESLPQMLGHAATWLDVGIEPEAAPALRLGLTPEEHAQQIETVLVEANTLYEQALARLSDEERAFIEQAVTEMGMALIEDLMVLRIPDQERLEKVRRLVELAARVDRRKLIAAAVRLSPLIAREYLDGLRDDLAGRAPGIILRHDTPLGPIILAGTGQSWFREPAAVLIDLGGDDFYTHASRRPFSVVIDLGGNDQHQATFEFAQGFGLCGIGLLFDEAGNDRYIARRWAQGSAAFGVGVLVDRAGDDVYRAADYSQGAAFCGVGLLVDAGGLDRYEAPRYAQALGMPGGFGALIERDGDDHYYCSGRDLTGYGTEGIFDAFGQGFGVGFRGLASGGIGLLVDDAGDDVYEGGNFAQGGGYYFGWGCLVDRGGDDQYLGSRYAQAHAAHQAIGYLEDHAGNDRYLARRGVGQSCAWDQSVSTLIDRQGDDVYSGGGFCLAASAHNGFAVLVDCAGRDRYERHKGQARAHPNDYHGGTCFSLLLDLGGGADAYPGQDRNGTVNHANQHGFFADLPGDLDDALAHFEEHVGQ